MSSNRQQRKAAEEKRKHTRPFVHIPVPDEWLDYEGEPWTLTKRGEDPEVLDFVGVLQQTRKLIPIKDWSDTDKIVDIDERLKDSDGYVSLPRANYEWFVAQVKEYGPPKVGASTGIWSFAQDVWLLVHYMETNKVEAPGEDPPDPKEEAVAPPADS